MSDSFDIAAARRNYRARGEECRARLRRLWERAREEADEAVRIVVEHYRPKRVIQWGSVLRPEAFTEISDIDIAVEGIDDMESWSRMERDLLAVVSFPLDLVRFDRIHPEHQRQILSRGVVVYER